MTIQQIADAVAKKYPKHLGDIEDMKKCARENGAYEDDANVHTHLNGEWICMGYDQWHVKQSYLDKATAYAQKLVAEASK